MKEEYLQHTLLNTQLISIVFFMLTASISSLLALSSRHTLKTGLFMGLFSASCAGAYFFLNAPDVALTETSINALIGTTLYLATIKACKVGQFETRHIPSTTQTNIQITKVITCILSVMVILMPLVVLTEYLPQFGNTARELYGRQFLEHYLSKKDISYILTSQEMPEVYTWISAQFKIPNIVTTILASARGFDTMGEAVVILTAGIGVVLILRTLEAHPLSSASTGKPSHE